MKNNAINPVTLICFSFLVPPKLHMLKLYCWFLHSPVSPEPVLAVVGAGEWAVLAVVACGSHVRVVLLFKSSSSSGRAGSAVLIT